jgi:hypothetical protein
MSHTLTIDDKRISSGDLQAADDVPPKMTDWWADFGLGDRSNSWPSPPLEKCVETSGLYFLKQVAEDLKRQPRPLMQVDTPKTSDVLMLPPGVLPTEAAMAAPHRSVWSLPGIVGAFVLVVLLSVLGTLWYSGNIFRPESAALTVAPSKVPGPAQASRAVVPAVTEPSAIAPSPKPATPVPAATLVAVDPSTTVEDPSVTPAVTEDRDATRKRRKRSKRSGRSGDRDRDLDADDEKPAPVKPGYSLYATLGAASGKTSPTSGAPAASRSGGIATEAVAPKRTQASASDTYRMLKVAASGESSKPVAAPALPVRLTAAAISRGVGQARSAVQACLRRFGFGRAAIRLRVTVSGATGRVTAARVQGRFKSTPAGSCALRRVRSLRFPRFSRSSQTLLLPIRTY